LVSYSIEVVNNYVIADRICYYIKESKGAYNFVGAFAFFVGGWGNDHIK
jgi:hypothetical protein